MNLGKLDASIKEIAGDYIKAFAPGMAILIGEKGKIVYKNGFGFKDIENEKPIDYKTSFIIASVTKQFTTMAILMLKERGLLDYDERISRFFPDFPEYKNLVTIRHLMTHTSGIKEYFSSSSMLLPKSSGGNIAQEDILDIIKSNDGLDFEPGTKYSYCNSAYVMLGAIIEKLSGISYGDFLKENIFDPLGMKGTAAGSIPNEDIENMAVGYRLNEQGDLIKCPLDSITIGWADGNIISNVEDLFIWHNALNTDKLVKKGTLEEAFKPNVLKDGSETNYGFGYFIGERQGIKEIWHTGGTIGYISRFSRFVDEDIAVIMLTNFMQVKRDEIFSRIAEVALEGISSSQGG